VVGAATGDPRHTLARFELELIGQYKHRIATARHPRTGRLYAELVFQPVLELLAHRADRRGVRPRLTRRG